MQIGIDARLPTYQMGGISRYVIQLVAALAMQDDVHQYTVFHSRKDSINRFPQRTNISRQNLWTPCHHSLERWLLSMELIVHKLDILHSPDFIPPVYGARRHVITVHDLNFLYYPQFLTGDSKRYYADQIGWAVDHADGIIADSEHTRQDLIEQLNVAPSRVTTIHLAANPIFAAAAASVNEDAIGATLRDYDLRSGFILFVGTIEPRKNLPTLLKAYAVLREQAGLATQLVIAGRKGWLYDDVFDAINRLKLQAHVRHLEVVSDEELARLYLAAGLLALPSYYEGFGLPALEAMHCRCPVIASDRASLPEVVGQAGILLPPDDVEAWATSMQLVLTDDGRRGQMIEAGLKQARQFSWARTAAETRSVYERLS